MTPPKRPFPPGSCTFLIADVENVETVFKDGVGYDTAALLKPVRRRYGEYSG